MNTNILLAFGPFTLTKFGLCIGLGAILWILSACAVQSLRYRRMPQGAVWLSGALMVVFGLVFSRAVYCAANFDIYFSGGMDYLNVWEGGMSMCGALAGAFAGLMLAAPIARVRIGRLANCFGPGIGLFAACAVIAQTMIGEGWGKVAEAQWVAGTVMGVEDIYGDIRYAVYRLELIGCAAAFIFGIFPLLRRTPARFSAWNWALGVYCAVRIVTASMREGAVLRVEYFRIEQIAAVAMLLVIALCRICGDIRRGAGRGRWGAVVPFLAGAGIATWMEFAVDREGDLEVKYLVMALVALLCLIGALSGGGRTGMKNTKKARAR